MFNALHRLWKRGGDVLDRVYMFPHEVDTITLHEWRQFFCMFIAFAKAMTHYIVPEWENTLLRNANRFYEDLERAAKSKDPLRQKVELLRKAALTGYCFRTALFGALQHPLGPFYTEKELTSDLASRGFIMPLTMLSTYSSCTTNISRTAWVVRTLNFLGCFSLLTRPKILKFWSTHYAFADMVVKKCGTSEVGNVELTTGNVRK